MIIPYPPPGTAGCYPESGSRLPQSKAFGGMLAGLLLLSGCGFQSPVDDLAFRTPGTWAEASSGPNQEKFLKNEVGQAGLAEKQAERDYAEGFNPNILSVLEAQRRANNTRAAIIRLRNQRLQNRFDLHLALGGDFRTGA